MTDRRAPRAVLERIARDRGPVVLAEPLIVLSAMGEFSGDPPSSALPWHTVAAGFDRAWPMFRPAGATVAAAAAMLYDRHPDWALAVRREVRDVSIVRADFAASRWADGERPRLYVWLRNDGTAFEERADVEVWLNGALVAGRRDVAARGTTRLEFELDPPPSATSPFALRIVAIPKGRNDDARNDEFRLDGRLRYDADQRLHAFLKDKPFVHSWLALQGCALL